MEHNIEVLARQRLALKEQQESIAEKIAQIDALLVDAIEVGGSIDLDGHPVLRVQQKRTFSPDLARDLVPADLIEAATVPTLDAKEVADAAAAVGAGGVHDARQDVRRGGEAAMITADMVRRIIVDHDAARPRSQQTDVGPSDLSSPCDRKLVHQIIGTPPVTDNAVNLMAWVGTQMHSGMEAALKADDDWLTEQRVGVDLGDGLILRGSLDAYHKPSKTIVDWKSVGPSALAKYRRQSPDNYLTQVSIYGLLAVLSGRMSVEHTAIAYIPRNGDLSETSRRHPPVEPGPGRRGDRTAATPARRRRRRPGRPALVGTADDCRFCRWWMPGSDRPQVGCPGHNPQIPPATRPRGNPKKKRKQQHRD